MEQWSKVLRQNRQKTWSILSYLQSEKIGTITPDLSECSEKNRGHSASTLVKSIKQKRKTNSTSALKKKAAFQITITCRRMVNDEKEREKARIRKEKERLSHGKVTEKSQDCHGDVTDLSQDCHAPSSDLLSSSSKKNINILLKDDSLFEVDQQEITLLGDTFPNIKTIPLLKYIRKWNLDNPGKRKTKRGIKKHITTWFSNENAKTSSPYKEHNETPTSKEQSDFDKECEENRKLMLADMKRHGYRPEDQ